MIPLLLISVLLLREVSPAITSNDPVVYCVKPSKNSSCLEHSCQKCETLQFFHDNVNEMINRQNNVTLMFMPGTHNICSNDFEISAPTVRMIGRDNYTTIMDVCQCELDDSNCGFSIASVNASIERLKLVNYSVRTVSREGRNFKQKLHVKDCSFHKSSLHIAKVELVNVEGCMFHEKSTGRYVTASKLLLRKCTFYATSLLVIYDTVSGILDGCLVYSSYDFETSYLNITGKSEFSIQFESVNVYNLNNQISSSNVTLSGNISYTNNTALYGGAIHASSASNLSIAAGANVAFINNTALAQGGAVYLSSSTLYVSGGAKLTFINNTALDKGGAVYIYPGLRTFNLVEFDLNAMNLYPCFFTPTMNMNGKWGYIHFDNNLARNGGDEVYGAGLHDCPLVKRHSDSISAVSSDPLRVCRCDSNGKPVCSNSQCAYEMFVLEVYPGENFTVSVAIVGADYGTTTGVLYANLYHAVTPNVKLVSTAKDGHVIHSPKQCSDVSLTLFSEHTPEAVTMFISTVYSDTPLILHYNTVFRDFSYSDGKYCYDLLLMPIAYNITLLPCPPGFTLLNQRCDCFLHHILFDTCKIANKTGYFSWNSNAWTSIYKDGMLYDTHCPFEYCNMTGQLINLLNDSDSQCVFNRAGRLCGGCREGYSLAIGSSHCIQCPSNNNLAILIFFIVAGFLLVLLITALNLTVSRGMINGLIFYANVVWTYQSMFCLQNQEQTFMLIFLKTFIAWINLDFGIEACFISGLTAFWKTWLQFIFPFYIWIIAGLIILASRYSTRLTNLLGNRAVPVLSTLFLLSYIKLLRLVVTALEFSILMLTTDNNSTKIHSLVWAVDGNLSYFGFPHILLFLAGLATLLFLCLPYTLLLLFMQLIRRLPNFKLVNWIMQFHPVYDAYFAPLKHKHQYWFGVLLLTRVIVLMTFVSTFAIPQYVNLLLLLILGVMLTFFIAVVQPYRSRSVLTLQTSSFVNLSILAGFRTITALSSRPTLQTIAVGVSTGVAFLQFCGIVLYTVMTSIRSAVKQAGYCNHGNGQEELSTDFIDDYDRDIAEAEVKTDETQPLLHIVDNVPTYQSY